MGNRVRLTVVSFVSMMAFLSACTLLTSLDGFTGGELEDGGRPAPSDDGAAESDVQTFASEGGPNSDADADSPSVDAQPAEIQVSGQYASPNGATFATDAGGTSITGYMTFNHPAIVPVPQPTIPSDDYTVLATVRVPTDSEFGILTRVQPSGAAVVFGSKYGAADKPYLGAFGPPDWDPAFGTSGPAYTLVPDARYKLKVRAMGALITAKMWNASATEPPTFDTAFAGPYSTGRGVGFYTYFTNGSVLESLVVTVP